jgi:biopolymer transport protein ExbB
MWPLLGCSVVALTVTLERLWWRWRQSRRQDPQRIERALQLAHAGHWEQSLQVARESPDPAAAMILRGLEHRQSNAALAMTDAAQDYLASARRGLHVLDTIITLAPMLGILGTVTGIINSFQLLGDMTGQDPRAVVSGIAEALITTVAGLIIAIGTLVPFNMLASQVRRDARRLEKLGTELELAQQRSTREDRHATHR